MKSGRIVLEETSEELENNPDVKEFYLGVTEHGRRKNYREVKVINAVNAGYSAFISPLLTINTHFRVCKI